MSTCDLYIVTITGVHIINMSYGPQIMLAGRGDEVKVIAKGHAVLRHILSVKHLYVLFVCVLFSIIIPWIYICLEVK